MLSAHQRVFLALDKAQQFALQVRRQFSDLVQEQGAVAGQLDLAGFSLRSTGESAFFMAMMVVSISWKAVIMMTLVKWASAWILSKRSKPLQSGSRISMTAISGWCR
jgi:hypothetical protein